MGKTVSIIIPALNAAKYLPGCLDAVGRLRYPEGVIEVIVVDNGSSDGTRKIAASHGAVVIRDDRKSVAGLRNLGALRAAGEILAFVDADCVVSKGWVENAAAYFGDEKTAAWGAPPAVPADATWVQEAWYQVRRKEQPVQEVTWLESMNLFVRRKLFFEIGGFNERLTTCEDVDFCYRICQYGSIISDDKLEVIHLGEAATVSEFFDKETWRAKDNLAGVFSHGLTLKELPSLSIPFYFGLFMPLLLFGCIIGASAGLFFTALFFSLLPSAAALYRVRKKAIGPKNAMRILALLQVYFLARTLAVVLMRARATRHGVGAAGKPT